LRSLALTGRQRGAQHPVTGSAATATAATARPWRRAAAALRSCRFGGACTLREQRRCAGCHGHATEEIAAIWIETQSVLALHDPTLLSAKCVSGRSIGVTPLEFTAVPVICQLQ